MLSEAEIFHRDHKPDVLDEEPAEGDSLTTALLPKENEAPKTKREIVARWFHRHRQVPGVVLSPCSTNSRASLMRWR